MKLVGYCPSCSIAIAEHELGYRCMKCNRILLLDELKQQAPEPVEKQSGKEVAYNRRSVATPGVWNGSSKKGLDNAGTTM
jgi:hypothetical protein